MGALLMRSYVSQTMSEGHAMVRPHSQYRSLS